MSHQMQIIQYFSPPNLPVIEKMFLCKNCLISEN